MHVLKPRGAITGSLGLKFLLLVHSSLCVFLTIILSGSSTYADTPLESDSVAILMPYISLDRPLNDGAGLMARYTHTFMSANISPGLEATQHAAVLGAAIGYMSLARDADGTVMEGELNLWYPSVSLSESWILGGGKWILRAGGGMNWYFPDAKGNFSVSAPIGISNEFDVDAGPGFYAGVGMERSLGANWEFVFDLGYLAASLQAEHRFVISGVSGVPESADFDLSGPQAAIGIAYRF